MPKIGEKFNLFWNEEDFIVLCNWKINKLIVCVFKMNFTSYQFRIDTGCKSEKSQNHHAHYTIHKINKTVAETNTCLEYACTIRSSDHTKYTFTCCPKRNCFIKKKVHAFQNFYTIFNRWSMFSDKFHQNVAAVLNKRVAMKCLNLSFQLFPFYKKLWTSCRNVQV